MRKLQLTTGALVTAGLLISSGLPSLGDEPEQQNPASRLPSAPALPLQGKAEENPIPFSPLEGKLEQIQTQTAPLQGRLEQIGSANADLPLELTSSANKNVPLSHIKLLPETPQLDEYKPLQGSVNLLTAGARFPDFVVGTWGGHLKVLMRRIDKPDITDARLVVGELGDVVVRFLKNDDRVQVKPAAIFFQRRKVDRLRHILRRNGSPEQKDKLDGKVFWDYPVVALGSKHWSDALGKQWDDRVLHNSLQTIGKNGAEEDVVFERTENGALYGYRETVVRFTWQSKKLIFAQVAVADYAPDRTPRKRTIMEGYITPDWRPVADEIEKVTEMPWSQVVSDYEL